MQQSQKQREMPKSPGRPAGKGNKTTETVRQVIAKMAEMNAPKLNAWLARVAEEDPAKAIDCYTKLIEYHIPKQRQLDIVSTHIDIAAILERARGRVLDVTTAQQPIQEDMHNGCYVKPALLSDDVYMQQVTERVSSELRQAYADPTEFEPGEDEG